MVVNKLLSHKNIPISIDKLTRSNSESSEDNDLTDKKQPPNKKLSKSSKNNTANSSLDYSPKLSPMKTPLKNLSSNWPDINEINSTLEEFDSMLNEYEIDMDQKGKTSFNQNLLLKY